MGLGKRIESSVRGLVSRSASDILQWQRGGFTTPPPQAVKISMLANYMESYGLKKFIETGTFRGSTLCHMAKRGYDCMSIELADDLHQAAKRKFASYSNVQLLLGDSGNVLPRILNTLSEPALFWLDGHYSGGPTARADKDTPITTELEAILNHRVEGHVILIDDARLFNGENDYPPLHELLTVISRNGRFRYEVHCDSIHLIPTSKRSLRAA
ncbi:hypothetical protein CA13_43330 [Planctomycetes bacterium CA13]|uniref:O-methyltransferase n=1 Tax=Novipirellula herctigrandis TaxID=2527986 RepID=A0A5C5Z6R1_9BACT|nr:hypothetical protein CA13_43330 [Planctomycetes bacterium CA13]